jgi:hypothetical protein
MRKSILFKVSVYFKLKKKIIHYYYDYLNKQYTIGMLYQFYYGQLIREGLFSLQFLTKKN